MKKRFTVIAGFLCATGVSFSQVAINAPQRQMTSAKVGIEKFNGKAETTNQGTAKAGGDIVWSSDFSTPSDWTIGTSGQGTFQIVTTTPAAMSQYMGGAMASTTAANGFAAFNGVQYLVAANVDPQNTWVSTPSIDFTGIASVDFIFQQRYRAFNSDVTYVEFSADGGTTWTVSEIVNASVVTNAPAVQNTITLTFNVGGTADGMFRFRWESPEDDDDYGSGYGWMVDDVSIVEGYADNVAMGITYTSIGAQELSYTKMPVAQTSGAGSVSFGAEVKNTGTNANDIALKVTSGAYDYTGSYVSIAPFTTDSVAILTANGMAIPTSVGVSNFTFTAVADGVTLEQPGDDSKVVNFEVTNYTYAVDGYDGTPASITGSFTGWQNGTGDPAVGTLYEVFNSADLRAIHIGISPVSAANQATYVDNQFFAKIFKYNTSTQVFDYVDESDAHVLVAADFGTLVPFVLNSPITLDAGGLYLVVAAFYNNSPVPVGMAGTSIAGSTMGMDGATFIGLASDAATPHIVRAPVVRLSFDPSVSVDKVVKDENNVTVFPNPFDAQTEVQFTVSSSASVAVNVTDVMGREVISVPATNYASGTHAISLDGANLEAGLYNYTITIGNNVVTKRIIKK